MFKNMKIGTRLGFGFGLIVLLICALSVIMIVQIKNVSGKLDTVVNDRFPKTRIANEVINEINIIARAMRNMAILNDSSKIKEENARIDISAEHLTSYFDTLQETITSKEGKEKLAAALNARQAYVPLQTEIRKLFLEKKRDAGIPILMGQFRDLQNDYMKKVNDLIEFQTELTEADGIEGIKTAKNAELMIYLIAGFILLFSVIAAVFITGSITKPITQCIAIADKVAAGDTSVQVKTDSKDETGMLLSSLEKMINSIKALVSDAGMLSKAAVEGKLDTRADASKHQGDYRKIVEGVNGTLDAVIGPLNVAAEYVDRISKGDIPQKITDTYHGDFNEIKNNLNQCIDALSSLIAQMKNMADEHNKGDIDVAIPVDKFEGVYKVMAQGTNDMVFGHIAVKKKAMACIAEFGKGNFDAPLEKFPGKKAFINDTIEKVRANIKDFIVQMKNMAHQHDIGDIDVAMNETSFEGAYKEMAEGVNKMVFGHIAVKKKAMACVAEFGKGNFDAPLEKFPGKKAFINETIEGVRLNLKNIANELITLIEASKNGALSTRGNASAYLGDWQKMIKGVNEILDSILEPISEAATVLDKVAARDLAARVSGNYKGDHAKIKNSLNLAVDNLDKALQQVSEATEQVTSASQQISSGSQSLAQGANEQASSLEEVSSSLEEMASMTKQNADNATQAKSLSGEADENAKVGTEAMQRMSSAINRIKESSDQTAKIVKTIDEIAMQTNLLALNAAVEAARAGEAGRGFAVVAEEVRNLAQRSAQAAKNTADMISESVKNADDGVKIAGEVSQSFESIATSAKKVNDLIAEIAAASQEQSQGIDQVNSAVAQMDKVTQQNAANSEESASAAEELSSQAEELKTMIDQFTLSLVAAQHRPVSMRHEVKKETVAATMHNVDTKGKKAVKKQSKADEFLSLDDSSLKDF